MKKHLSGSLVSEEIVSSIHFLKSGSVLVDHTSLGQNLDSYEEASLAITQEFMFYALEREDWMSEFLYKMNKNLLNKKKNIEKPSFTLIQGGLSSTPVNN